MYSNFTDFIPNLKSYFRYILIGLINLSALGLSAQDVDELKSQLSTTQDKWAKASLYLDISWEYLYDDPEQTKFYAQKLIRFAKKHNLIRPQASGYGLMGLYYEVTGQYQDALETYYKAIELLESHDSLRQFTGLYYGNMAIVHSQIGNYPKAIEFQKKQLKKAEKYNMWREVITSYICLGNHYLNFGKPDTAKKYYYQALRLNKGQDKGADALIYSNLGDVYLQLGDLDSALYGYQYNYRYTNESGDTDLSSKMDANFDLAEYYIHTGRYKSARPHLDSALKIARQIKSLDFEESSLELLSQYYEQTGQPAKALEYYKKARVLADSIRGTKVKTKIAELETRFETQKKEAQIERLQSDASLKDLTIANQKSQKLNLTLLVVATSLLLLVIIIFLVRLRKKSAMLKAQHDVIRLKHQKLEDLMRESHHRIKNNLQVVSSLLKLQSKSIKSEVARTSLLEAYNRIKTIAIMHQNLEGSDGLEKINIKDFINQIVGNLKKSLVEKDSEIRISTELERLEMSTDKSIAIGLILNELITNSLKYAFVANRGDIEIRMLKTTDQVVFIVADNGQGFRPGYDPLKGTSLGYTIIQKLIEKLKGYVTVENNGGACIRIKIPYEPTS